MKQKTFVWLIVGIVFLVIVGSSTISALNAMSMFGRSGAFEGIAGIFGGVIVKP
jgi:uncharacterized membrane protein